MEIVFVGIRLCDRLKYARLNALYSAMSRVVRGINREMQAWARAGAGWAVQVARRIVAGPVRTAS
jgi:hypothetical protein